MICQFSSGIVFLYICVYFTVLFIEQGEEEEEEEEEERAYFLFLSLSVIARCFVSFILVQFFFTSVFMLQFCLFKE